MKMTSLEYKPEDFEKMPKPVKAGTTKLSWEDIYAEFLNRKIKPTRTQIINAFKEAATHINKTTIEYGLEGFHNCVQEAVSRFQDWTDEEDEDG